MKTLFFLICLSSLTLLSQTKSEVTYDDLYKFVYDYSIEGQLDSNMLSINLDSIFESVVTVESNKSKKNKFLHILYRASIIVDGYSNQSLEIGKTSLEFSENLPSDGLSFYFISYYKVDAINFNFWIRAVNVFTGVKDNFNIGTMNLLSMTDIEDEFRAFLIEDQIRLSFTLKKDVPTGLQKLKELCIYTNSQSVLNTYLNQNFKQGYYESFIKYSDSLKTMNRNQTLKLLKSYVRIGDFNKSNEVLRSFAKDSADSELNLLSAHIYYYLLNKKINLDLFKDMKLYYDYDPESVFNPVGDDQYIYMSELLINQSNHDKTIEYINTHLKNNDQTQDEYQYFRAIVFWKQKDYFNAKRLIHNLINNNDDLREGHLQNSLLVLSHIAFLTNDNENLENYIEQVDRAFIRKEWLHIYEFLLLTI